VLTRDIEVHLGSNSSISAKKKGHAARVVRTLVAAVATSMVLTRYRGRLVGLCYTFDLLREGRSSL
jgi:hypothetical protein